MAIGKKDDAGLPPVQQGFLSYFPRAIMAAALVSRFGAQKYNVPYSEQNWRAVPDASLRYSDALARHLLKEQIEGLYDSESKLLHAAHAFWDAAAKLELLLSDGTPLVQPDV